MTNQKNNKFYVTTPIYYASGKPHLGHAYTSIGADVLARWNRNIGKDVFFLTGTDEHGQKIVEKANKSNMTPQEFVDSLIPHFKEQLEKLNISYDYFIRTTNKDHKKFVQKMLQKAYDKGDIYKGEYEGLYCVDCERYYKKDELIDGKLCPDHKRKVEFLKDENYFFKLSKYQDKLLKLYKENENFLSPKSKAQETLNFVKEGLDDISISRHKSKLEWGIELPFDKDHVTYVWFDALYNYISALEINKKQDFWPADVHIMAKDIMRFHKVFWPAFLMSTDYELPKKIFAHGWWTVNGEKMGKSMGNAIDPIEIVRKYGADEFRYFVLAIGAFGDDLDFSEELFAQRVNNDLNNDLGNFVSRVHAMTNKYFGGNVPGQEKLTQDEVDLVEKLNIFKPFNEAIQNLQFNKSLEILWSAIRETNAYINKVAPWKEQDMKKLSAIINTLNFTIKTFANYIDCFMPTTAQRIRRQYNFQKEDFSKFLPVQAGHKLGEKDNLFTKIQIEKKEQKEDTKHLFEQLNLKVGQIVKVEKIKDSDKLYKLQVNLGDETRQILSGLQQIYKQKDLENRKVIVLANLKPAKLAGEESNGMILACDNSNNHDDCGLLETDLKIGENIKWNGKVANNKDIIKIKIFQKVEMFGRNNKVILEGKELEKVRVDKGFEGRIC